MNTKIYLDCPDPNKMTKTFFLKSIFKKLFFKNNLRLETQLLLVQLESCPS